MKPVQLLERTDIFTYVKEVPGGIVAETPFDVKKYFPSNVDADLVKIGKQQKKWVVVFKNYMKDKILFALAVAKFVQELSDKIKKEGLPTLTGG